MKKLHIWKQLTDNSDLYVLNGTILFQQLSYLFLGLASLVIVKLLVSVLLVSNKLNGEQHFYFLFLVGHFPVVNSHSEHFFLSPGSRKAVSTNLLNFISTQFTETLFVLAIEYTQQNDWFSDWLRRVQLIPICTLHEYNYFLEVDTKYSEINTVYQRLWNATTKHLKTRSRCWPEVFRRIPKSTRRFPKLTRNLAKISEVEPKTCRRFPKYTQRLPKISKFDPKNLEGVRSSTEVFRRFPAFDRRISKVSELNTNKGDTKLTVTALCLINCNFVEKIAPTERLVQLWELSKHHSYLLITNCTRGRAIFYAKSKNFFLRLFDIHDLVSFLRTITLSKI